MSAYLLLSVHISATRASRASGHGAFPLRYWAVASPCFRCPLVPSAPFAPSSNEQDVGAALASSDLRREEVFVTTKLWNNRHGDVEAACRESLRKLGTS